MTEKSNVSGLYDHLGYWLHRIANEVHVSFERRLAHHGVTVSQWCALIALYKHQIITVRDLAAFIGVDQGAASRLVRRLEEKGLVTRIADEQDRRSQHLLLTTEAEELIPVLSAEADANDHVFFGASENAALPEIKNLLLRLAEHTGLNMSDFPDEFQIKK